MAGAVVLVGGLFVVLDLFYDPSLDAMALTGTLVPVATGYVVGVLGLGLVVYRFAMVVRARRGGGRFDIEITRASPEAWTALSTARPLLDCGAARIELSEHGVMRLHEELLRGEAELLVGRMRAAGAEATLVSAGT